VLPLIAVLLFTSASFAVDDQRAAVATNAARATQIAEQLKRLNDADEEGAIEYDVPAPARPLLTDLKHALRSLIIAQLAVTPDASAKQLSNTINTVLQNAGTRFPDDSQGGYGWLYPVEVQKPLPGRALISVQATVGIACGSDSSLYIFELKNKKWELTLSLESNGYEEVSGAQGSLEYVVGNGPPGPWWVATANINPWCTSVWQSLRYNALQAGDDPEHPRILLSEQRGVNLNFEPAFKLKVVPHGFELIWGGGMELDVDIMTRPLIARYIASGEKFDRVSPYAFRPEDFLDEWVQLPWIQAQALSSQQSNLLHSWHEVLADQKNKWQTHFDQVKRCSRNSWEIGLLTEMYEGVKRPQTLPEELFFRITELPAGYHVDAVATRSNPKCGWPAYQPQSQGLDLPH
jgi:hypothetical protein